jgi:hypothetical protein
MMSSGFEQISDEEFRNVLFAQNNAESWNIAHLEELENRGTAFLSGEERITAQNTLDKFHEGISAAMKPISDQLEKQKLQLAGRIAELKITLPKIEIPSLKGLLDQFPINPRTPVSESFATVVEFARHDAQDQKAQTEILLKILDVLDSTRKSQPPKWVGWVTFYLLVAGTAWAVVSDLFF